MTVSGLLAKVLPAALMGRLDYLSGHHRVYAPRGSPMHLQASRMESIRRIIFDCRICRIVETGVYRGVTTEWLARFGLPVIGAEINARFASFSKLRLRKWSNIEIRCQDSVQFLKDLAAVRTDNGLPTLFYLDAHGAGALPLRDEIEAIFPVFPNAIAIIDDFEVPGDSGYVFDSYGPGQALTLEYIASANVPHLSLFSPATPSQFESGGRAGWIIATANIEHAQRLDRISLLRR